MDASGPLGLPNFLEGASKTKMATAISALIFSPDSEVCMWKFSSDKLIFRHTYLDNSACSHFPYPCTELGHASVVGEPIQILVGIMCRIIFVALAMQAISYYVDTINFYLHFYFFSFILFSA